MEPELIRAIGILAVTTTAISTLLGFAWERAALGAFVLGGFAAVASGLSLVGALAGGWVGLAVAIVVVAFFAYRIGRGLGKARGAVFVPGLWFGYCGSCAIGYWAGGMAGWLTITLPSLLVFWLGLFAVSRYLLPLDDRKDWSKAFRALLTFSLGTNYPYHVLEDRELAERVSGNPYGQLFAGPGIVLTGPAHAPIIWEGTKFKRVGRPGLTFTGRFETVYQLVDLRPQLRSFDVDAITEDGIRIRILTFLPFQLDAGEQEPDLGTSFPSDARAIARAIRHQPVEEERKIPWDELVRIVGTRVLRRIISEYRFDDLCAPLDMDGELLDPKRDPRIEIRDRLVEQVGKELAEFGIKLIGGGISNLEPADKSVLEARMQAWRAERQREMAIEMGKAEANAIWELERAHVKAQAELISAVRRIVEHRPGIRPEVLTNMAALRFVEALEELACRPSVREAAPEDTGQMLEYLRRSLALE
jgi:hypothetical protein